MNFYYMLAVFEEGGETNIGVFQSRAQAIDYAKSHKIERFECRRLYYDSAVVSISFSRRPVEAVKP